jgi:hypothetical protein
MLFIVETRFPAKHKSAAELFFEPRRILKRVYFSCCGDQRKPTATVGV